MGSRRKSAFWILVELDKGGEKRWLVAVARRKNTVRDLLFFSRGGGRMPLDNALSFCCCTPFNSVLLPHLDELGQASSEPQGDR